MAASAAIATIRSAKSGDLIAPEVFDARTPVPAFCIDPDLVNKICFLHVRLFFCLLRN